MVWQDNELGKFLSDKVVALKVISGEGDYAIYVAPSTIVLSAPCPWVTIHTDVPYVAVDAVSVEVDGKDTPVAMTYDDSCGRFVAKLKFGEVASRCGSGSATVSMALVINGNPAVAATTVTVKD